MTGGGVEETSVIINGVVALASLGILGADRFRARAGRAGKPAAPGVAAGGPAEPVSVQVLRDPATGQFRRPA